MKHRLSIEQEEALIKKMGGYEMVLKFLGENIEPKKKWQEQQAQNNNYFICFSVASDGTTGEEWIERLISKGFRVSKQAQEILISKRFEPTTCETKEIVILKGTFWEEKSSRLIANIRFQAEKFGLLTPDPEIACLIRERFIDRDIEDMGLSRIVVMHDPIEDNNGYTSLLNANTSGTGSWLGTSTAWDRYCWGAKDGFAFISS